MDDDVKIALIAFNITVTVYALYRLWTHTGAWTFLAAIGAMFIALVLGGLVAGVTYFIKTKLS